jgi:HPt (histidine-containing phosphotransfer) domain-containing protein
MIVLSTGDIQAVSAPPLAPIDRPIDLEHLSRMTLGDRSLEREVLQLFDRQASMLLARMQTAEPAVVAASAHTLKGSALGIGAFEVARAATAVEFAAGCDVDELADRVRLLGGAIDEVRAVITGLLRAH